MIVKQGGRQVFKAMVEGREVSFPDGRRMPWDKLPQDDKNQTARGIVEGIPNDGVEHAHAIAYNSQMEPLAWSVLSTGGVDSTPFKPREIFSWALTVPRTRYVGVAHNHPSGNTAPSGPDVRCTAILAGVGKALGIEVVHSLVVTHENNSWEAIPLEDKLAPQDPNDPGPEPQGDPNEDEDPDPEGDPEGEGEGENEGEGEGRGEGTPKPVASPHSEPGDPGGASSVKGLDDTAKLDDLRRAVSNILGRG